MKISQAAEASGCHLETIRYYEKIGLLPHPTRTDSGYRAYTSADIERLRFIARGRDLGFSLEEIRSLLQLASDERLSCDDVDRLARTHLTDIRARQEDLRRMADELERVIISCHGGQRAECTILSTLRQPTQSFEV
ncbi:MAG: helix-turn-helix domain-containing protein [Propionivibrio sp.]|jgi:MerR family mercuric resistance operon transcriptional regulator|uniref:MerR family transcriptional regulator n=1 Tax=Pseudoxanthomonas TaxID=83618 RepID=UPI000BDDE4D2|nr:MULTISPECIES: helix-turn-helix domain-containing protein [Pseudoxanthomonas]MBP8276420.1 helix-turn-helix domain-containing protein [Propionivibrio sp.]OZB67405.1 MAG: MerR family transcriptional regulator [Xanthomonadales bacterium 14-68-21]KAF1693162.1 MerR family transcriptional regulator [Pseudoxanthomonas jiangsuensis]MCR6627785.1 helix-turn-helix domain-containing protein [Pseudoxanthomonas sp.]MCR6687053.1 helix-turn-helix domain-containing protein [Pseudoxanthomonas sp.]